MTAALKKIFEQVERLSEQERRELRALLEGVCGGAVRPMTEAQLEQDLSDEGLLTLPTPPTSLASALASPIATRGRPLSELLVEERR